MQDCVICDAVFTVFTYMHVVQLFCVAHLVIEVNRQHDTNDMYLV